MAWGQCVWYVHRQLLLPWQRTMNTGRVKQLCLNGPTKRKSQGSKSWIRCRPKRRSLRSFSFFFTFLELEVVHIINGSISLHGFLDCQFVPSLSTIYTQSLLRIQYDRFVLAQCSKVLPTVQHICESFAGQILTVVSPSTASWRTCLFQMNGVLAPTINCD